ncbi:MAG TPA: type IV secretion system DNA-binding domain-containing protein, partial [Actinomycetota bacterium]|nr:type IV secretion system DNA-binding domain-containing protein [Actinomycetota bacterium]
IAEGAGWAGDILDAILTVAAGPPRSFRDLVAALEAVAAGQMDVKGVNRETREGTLTRYRRFAATAAGSLDGTWAFEDTRASYLLLDGVTLGKDAPRLARFLVEDFAHYATSRKPPDRRTLLLIDEFSALRLPNAASKFEKLRSFGAAIVIAAQSPEGLHDDPRETDRLLNTAGTIITHRIVDPEPVVARAGTRKRAERSHQLDGPIATGAGSLRIQDTYRIDPNDLRSLPTGTAWTIHAGRTAKIAITRTTPTPERTASPDRPFPEPLASETLSRHQPEAPSTLRPPSPLDQL